MTKVQKLAKRAEAARREGSRERAIVPRTQNQRSKVIDRKAKPGSPPPRQASPRNAKLARNGAHNETRHVHESIAQVVELDQREQESHGFSECLAHRIALFGGSTLYVSQGAAT